MDLERLNEVLETKLDELSNYEVTTDGFGYGVQSLERLAKIQLDYERVELDKAKHELMVDNEIDKKEFEREKFENQKLNDELARKSDFRKDIGTWVIAGVGIAVDIGLHIVGFVFEEEGTVRSQAFRNYYLKHFVKKR